MYFLLKHSSNYNNGIYKSGRKRKTEKYNSEKPQQETFFSHTKLYNFKNTKENFILKFIKNNKITCTDFYEKNKTFCIFCCILSVS